MKLISALVFGRMSMRGLLDAGTSENFWKFSNPRRRSGVRLIDHSQFATIRALN
jgi:hypothetical protein